jgi:hypothetical protein
LQAEGWGFESPRLHNEIDGRAYPGDMSNHLAIDTPSHGVNCDPLWYYAANLLAPKDIGSTKRRGWIEGFVAAMETLAEGGEDGETLLETVCGVASTI